MSEVGNLYRVITPFQVFHTGDMVVIRRRHFTYSSDIPVGTIFLVTKHRKPMIDFTWDFEELLKGNQQMKPLDDFLAISWSTELLIGERFAYIWDSEWEKVKTLCERLDSQESVG
jgi:hypothetical protein